MKEGLFIIHCHMKIGGGDGELYIIPVVETDGD